MSHVDGVTLSVRDESHNNRSASGKLQQGVAALRSSGHGCAVSPLEAVSSALVLPLGSVTEGGVYKGAATAAVGDGGSHLAKRIVAK